MSPESRIATGERDEEDRLRALLDLHILDSSPERVFEESVQIAAAICKTPVAAISLLDRERQWLKAKVGIDVDELPRADSFCNFVLEARELLHVADATQDFRFRNNPHVLADHGLRFYAGTPLTTTAGYVLGTLCVTDTVPHSLDDSQRETLKALGRHVASQMELRSKLAELQSLIAEKSRVEQELRARTLRFTAFMDHSPAIGFIKDSEGKFIYYNRMFAERFGVSATQWIGKSAFDLFPAEFASAYHADDMDVLSAGRSKIVEETSPGPYGEILFWRTHKFPIRQEGCPDLLGGLSLDVSSEKETVSRLRGLHADLEATNARLTELSLTDGLTGLNNRRAFDRRLQEQAAAGSTCALVLLDLDHFKAINDTFGHPFGDSVLKRVADLLKGVCRQDDFLARIGGEEFAVLLKRPEKGKALEVADRMRLAVERYTWEKRPITVSIGLSVTGSALFASDQLVAMADEALYRAKQLGRNRTCVAPCSTVPDEYAAAPRSSQGRHQKSSGSNYAQSSQLGC